MSAVRVLVGTQKGAFILTSDARRQKWEVSGPHFAGWEIYHMKGSAVDPDRLYMSQSSGWFGQIIQRSNDGGKTWETGGNEFTYEGSPATHQWYDGTQHPWEFTRVWYLEPSPTDRDTVYAGVEDAAGGVLDNILQRLVLKLGSCDKLVQISDICLVMLAVMVVERFSRYVRSQDVPGIGQLRQHMFHKRLPIDVFIWYTSL